MKPPIEPSANEEKTPAASVNTAANPEAKASSDKLPDGDAGSKRGNVYSKGLRVCGNCGTELLGETCYQCGQPTKGLVRQFSSILGDFFDTVLNIDSRVFRSIGPLIYKPGFLTQEYFSGRRIRYVSPVRLFFFLAVLTFLLAQFSLPEDMIEKGDKGNIIQVNGGTSDEFSKAKTQSEVEAIRTNALTELAEAKKEVGAIPLAGAGLDQAKLSINQQADARIAQINQKAGVQTAAAAAKPVEDDNDGGNISFNGQAWSADKNPLKLDWLPDRANAWLNSLAQRAVNNGKIVNKDPSVIIKAMLSALPMTLFLMLPVFALLLKIMFIFKRRLYMEHLIVALHSHAFLMLEILLLIAIGDAKVWLGDSSWLHAPLSLMTALLFIWLPTYLFLMQKRVYQQGWVLTGIKYSVIGVAHLFLLTLAISLTLIVKMIWL